MMIRFHCNQPNPWIYPEYSAENSKLIDLESIWLGFFLVLGKVQSFRYIVDLHTTGSNHNRDLWIRMVWMSAFCRPRVEWTCHFRRRGLYPLDLDASWFIQCQKLLWFVISYRHISFCIDLSHNPFSWIILLFNLYL